MKTVRIDGSRIFVEDDLHREFSSVMGFPSFYGENWNAWLDCMSCVTNVASEMSTIHIASDEILRLHVIVRPRAAGAQP